MDVSCNHDFTHTGTSRLDLERGELVLLVSCDRCGGVVREVGRVSYHPQPRRLYVHLVELAARELGLDPARVERLRLAALRDDEGVEGLEGEVLQLCKARLGKASPAGSWRAEVVAAVERAWASHDRRLDRAAA
jgi:hypothetical protein